MDPAAAPEEGNSPAPVVPGKRCRSVNASGQSRIYIPASQKIEGRTRVRPSLQGRDCAERQRLENWKLRRALALPYFLRSTTRLSRVRKPPRLSTPRRSGS